MACSDLADRYEEEHDIFKMVYRALSLQAGHTVSHNMLKAIDASQKPLGNVFRTMKLQQRSEDVFEKKPKVQDAVTPRPQSDSKSQRSKGTLPALDSLVRARRAKKRDL